MFRLEWIDKLGEKANEGMLETRRRVWTNRFSIACMSLAALLNPLYLGFGLIQLWITSLLILGFFGVGVLLLAKRKLILGQLTVTSACNFGLLWVCFHFGAQTDLHFVFFFSAMVTPFLFSGRDKVAGIVAFSLPIALMFGFHILKKTLQMESVVHDDTRIAIELISFLAASAGAFLTIKRITDNLEFMYTENIKKTRLLRVRQESLTLRTEELNATLEALPDACLRVSADGIIREVNGTVRPIWKRRLREKSIRSILGEVIGSQLLGACSAAQNTGLVQTHQFRWSPFGIPLQFEARISSVGLGDCIINIRDETARNKHSEIMRQQEVKIFQSAKMATLGEMAGNIAHEINNPLAVILGMAEIIDGKLEEENVKPADLRKNVNKIVDTAKRIAKIVAGLKHFARDGQKAPMGAVNLASVLEETLTLCEHSLKMKGVSIKVDLPPNWVVSGRSIQLSQVFLNLIGNASDAITHLETKTISVTATQNDGKIEVRVQDSGSGIPAEIVEKLFNPFFTTKEVGKGTGLGLSISKGIIESMNGTLSYDDTKPNTTFVVRLNVYDVVAESNAA